MATARRANRGPSAAAENRRALVAAAVEVFGEQGIDAPLSAVAKRAGVGQGSLYRHFPDRMSLALAAFEDNVAELEELAARDGTVLDDLLTLVTEQTIASVAFVEMVTAAGDDGRLEAVTARVSAALDGAVKDSRRRGDLRRPAARRTHCRRTPGDRHGGRPRREVPRRPAPRDRLGLLEDPEPRPRPTTRCVMSSPRRDRPRTS
jgi:AcrR family transcriptional regulator